MKQLIGLLDIRSPNVTYDDAEKISAIADHDNSEKRACFHVKIYVRTMNEITRMSSTEEKSAEISLAEYVHQSFCI